MSEPGDLESIYRNHANALFAFTLNLTRSEADTHDLLQELFIKLHQRPSLLSSVENEQAFLFKTIYRMSIDLSRRKQARDKYQRMAGGEKPDLFAPGQDPDAETFSKALAAAMEELPPEQRAVVHLKLWSDCTFEQVAEILEISPNTAASRYRYGTDKLRQILRPIHREL